MGLRHRGRGFIGADVMRRQVAEGTAERLASSASPSRASPAPARTSSIDGRPAGTVTSGTLSPSLDVGIGMAYVPAAVAAPGHTTW